MVDPNRETIVRNVCWGDTKEIVRSVETDTFIVEIDNRLLYETSVAGIDSDLVYYFTDDYGLYEVGYMIQKDRSYAAVCISDYEKLKETLSIKYGEPIADFIAPLNSFYEYSNSDVESLQYGYAAYKTEWKIGNTKIVMGMLLQDFKINTIILISDTTYTPPTDTSGF